MELTVRKGQSVIVLNADAAKSWWLCEGQDKCTGYLPASWLEQVKRGPPSFASSFLDWAAAPPARAPSRRLAALTCGCVRGHNNKTLQTL